MILKFAPRARNNKKGQNLVATRIVSLSNGRIIGQSNCQKKGTGVNIKSCLRFFLENV